MLNHNDVRPQDVVTPWTHVPRVSVFAYRVMLLAATNDYTLDPASPVGSISIVNSKCDSVRHAKPITVSMICWAYPYPSTWGATVG